MTWEAVIPGLEVKSHTMEPNPGICIHRHLYTSLRNKCKCTHMLCLKNRQRNLKQKKKQPPNPKTLLNLRQPASCCTFCLTLCGAWRKTPTTSLHFCICKQGTEGTMPASSAKGTRMDKTTDSPSQKALPKFPS